MRFKYKLNISDRYREVDYLKKDSIIPIEFSLNSIQACKPFLIVKISEPVENFSCNALWIDFNIYASYSGIELYLNFKKNQSKYLKKSKNFLVTLQIDNEKLFLYFNKVTEDNQTDNITGISEEEITQIYPASHKIEQSASEKTERDFPAYDTESFKKYVQTIQIQQIEAEKEILVHNAGSVKNYTPTKQIRLIEPERKITTYDTEPFEDPGRIIEAEKEILVHNAGSVKNYTPTKQIRLIEPERKITTYDTEPFEDPGRIIKMEQTEPERTFSYDEAETLEDQVRIIQVEQPEPERKVTYRESFHEKPEQTPGTQPESEIISSFKTAKLDVLPKTIKMQLEREPEFPSNERKELKKSAQIILFKEYTPVRPKNTVGTLFKQSSKSEGIAQESELSTYKTTSEPPQIIPVKQYKPEKSKNIMGTFFEQISEPEKEKIEQKIQISEPETRLKETQIIPVKQYKPEKSKNIMGTFFEQISEPEKEKIEQKIQISEPETRLKETQIIPVKQYKPEKSKNIMGTLFGAPSKNESQTQVSNTHKKEAEDNIKKSQDNNTDFVRTQNTDKRSTQEKSTVPISSVFGQINKEQEKKNSPIKKIIVPDFFKTGK